MMLHSAAAAARLTRRLHRQTPVACATRKPTQDFCLGLHGAESGAWRPRLGLPAVEVGGVPRSWRLSPFSLCSVFSTMVCVAMPAWSVPGTHRTLRPLMRCQRARVSCTAISPHVHTVSLDTPCMTRLALLPRERKCLEPLP
jgi:hypothetical protein